MPRPAVLASLIVGLVVFASAGLGGQERQLVIGTRQAPPFVVREADGSWSGLSIELWRAAADALALDYRLVESAEGDLLAAVAAGHFDAAVGDLVMTPAGEARIDFSVPYLTSGLGIATHPATRHQWFRVARALATPELLHLVFALLLAQVAFGLLVWLAERRRNPDQFGGRGVAGAGAGLWWAAVTMTSVGYGDKTPVSPLGRALAVVWMFAGVVTISVFTAAVTSTLTVSSLAGVVKGPADLPRVRVGVVAGTAGATWAAAERLGAHPFPTVAAALGELEDGRLDAVVHDLPVLFDATARRGDRRVVLLPQTVEEEMYAVALPSDSPLRERVDGAILAHLQTPAWRRTLADYLGR
jgi:polar amino acid transport system substrate-binding protein